MCVHNKYANQHSLIYIHTYIHTYIHASKYGCDVKAECPFLLYLYVVRGKKKKYK